MNVLQVIEQREILGKQLTMYGDFEEPLFLAKEVANWIDYSESNVSKMLSNIDDDEKTTRTIIMSGSNYQTQAWFLTEDGLYEVLMQSRKPIAKQFKKEVKALLKNIRKGMFSQKYSTIDREKELIQQTAIEVAKVVTGEVMKAIIPILQEQKEQQLYGKRERKKTSIISRLDFGTRNMIEDMMCSGMYTYAEITKMLNDEGIKISLTSVHRYAQSIGL